jgi:hypothetical protein
MSFISTFKRENNTTSISVNIELNPNTRAIWKMNTDGFGGYVTIKSIEPIAASKAVTVPKKVEPVSTPKPDAATAPVKPVNMPKLLKPTTYPEADRTKHINAIKTMLAECDKTKGKENKAVIAIKILDYVSGEALDFTKSTDKFKEAVINKCYEIKQNNADMPEVVKKVDETLVKLGASTTIPDGWKKTDVCRACGDNHPTPVLSKGLNEVINACVDSQPPIVATPIPVEPKKEDTSALDLALFTALAKKYSFEPAIKNPKTYLIHFESYARWNHHSVKGSTKAEKMTSYFINCSDDGKRVDLMKTIFEKHSMIFCDAAMTLYYEWANSYNHTGKANRYNKMNEFATIHKTLFSA